jgi:excisionase family DNA binding protein
VAGRTGHFVTGFVTDGPQRCRQSARKARGRCCGRRGPPLYTVGTLIGGDDFQRSLEGWEAWVAIGTLPEVAKRLRVSVPTVRRYVARGDLAVVRLGAGSAAPIRVCEDALMAFIRPHSPDEEPDDAA